MNDFVKKFAKGEMLFKEGDPSTHVYLVQSGLISVYQHKNDKNIEVCQVSSSQVLGETALIESRPRTMSAKAINDSQVIAIPAELLKKQLDAAPQILRILVKSSAEKQKHILSELKDLKLEGDSSPCPMDHVAKVFGVIFHTARFMGETHAETKEVKVKWQPFKQYAHRIFLEAPLRLEHGCYVLVKLKYADMILEKDPNEPDEPPQLAGFTFKNLQIVEDFFEFYAHYYFKGASKSVMTTDDKCMAFLEALVEFTKDARVAPNGVAQAKYIETLDKIKAKLDFASAEYFERLEQRGLFVKRESNNQGGLILFHKAEFERMSHNWKIMREIEKWNQKGFVDLEEDEKKAARMAKKAACGSCQTALSPDMKFCPNCGEKQEEAA